MSRALRRWRARSEYHRLGLPDFYLWQPARQRTRRPSIGAGVLIAIGALAAIMLWSC